MDRFFDNRNVNGEELADSEAQNEADESLEDDKLVRSRFVRDEAVESDAEVVDIDDEDTNMSADIGAIKKKFGFSNEATGFLEDYGFERLDKERTPFRDEEQANREPATMTQIIDYDPPAIPSSFVSGSTHGVNQRYLKWNEFGMIRSFKSDDGDRSIEIEFHNSSVHSEIVMGNPQEYCLGDLSEQAVALASSPDGSDAPSELLVIHISSWDDSDSRRWTAQLPLKDNAVDVLVSSNMIAVITALRNIRIFNLSGTQRQVITHPGSLITACSYGYNLTVATINGSEYYEERKKDGKKKRQYQYSLTSYNFDEKRWFSSQTSNCTSVPLAITPSQKLEWLSYSSGGQLCSMDSSYTVRWQSPGSLWVPIFDGSVEVKNRSDAVWPICVIDGRRSQLRYLHCKGTRHPQISQKQAPVIGEWTIPLCQPDIEKTKLEQGLLMNELFQSQATTNNWADELSELHVDHVKTVFKLFAIACKSDRDMRAFDISQLVTTSRGIQMMCNYAASSKKQVLAEKVAEVGRENINIAPSKESIIAPRRVSLPKRRTSQIEKIVEAPEELEDDDGECEMPMDEARTAEDHDRSLISQQTQIPVQKFNRNPFKRAAETNLNDSTSAFDVLEASFDRNRKRALDDTTSDTPKASKKQVKLTFGKASDKNTGKENTGVTAYSLWLSENEESIKKEFSGQLEDYDKYCIGLYKVLSAAQKKEWKARAESA